MSLVKYKLDSFKRSTFPSRWLRLMFGATTTDNISLPWRIRLILQSCPAMTRNLKAKKTKLLTSDKNSSYPGDDKHLCLWQKCLVPSSEPMMASKLTYINVTRPQWVKYLVPPFPIDVVIMLFDMINLEPEPVWFNIVIAVIHSKSYIMYIAEHVVTVSIYRYRFISTGVLIIWMILSGIGI